MTKEEPCDSFFNFFNPPAIPNPEEEELDEDEMEQRQFELESDYEMGIAFHGPCVRARVSEFACVRVCVFRGGRVRECTLTQTYTERLIPHAIKWFTGEADDDDDDDEFEEGEEEEEEDDDEAC